MACVAIVMLAALIAAFLLSLYLAKARRRFEEHRMAMQYALETYQREGAGPAADYGPDSPSYGFAVLGFLLPPVGLALYLSWEGRLPFRAGSVGKGAIAGMAPYTVAAAMLTVMSLIA